MVWCGHALWLIPLAVVPADASARTVAEHLEHGLQLYYGGQLEEALGVLDAVESEAEATVDQRVQALTFQAFSLYLLELHPEAREVWQRVLAIKPEIELDPVEVSPELITFFRAIPPSEPAVETPAEPQPEVLAVPAASTGRACGDFLCLVPFGVGQFANGRTVKGVIFASLELALIGLNVSMYWINESEYERYSHYRDRAAADRRLLVQYVALGLFATAVVAGIIDAYVFY